MDFQHVVNVVVGGAVAALGWFARTIFSAVKELERDLSSHKVEVAKTYATNSDLSRIDDKLDRILDKLNAKADR